MIDIKDYKEPLEKGYCIETTCPKCKNKCVANIICDCDLEKEAYENSKLVCKECGKEIEDESEEHHMLLDNEDDYDFCSKDCLKKFINS
jgi:hypothetical protein